MLETAAPDPIDVAVTLHRAGRLEEAERAYRAIIATDPGSDRAMDARNNLFALVRAQARVTDADRVVAEAHERRPSDPEWRMRLAVSRLAIGDYRAGWPLYEARREISRDRVRAPALRTPEWDGSPVGSLLVWGEQGFGDVLMFARYIPELQRRGVRVTVLCQPALARSLAQLDVSVIPMVGAVSLPPHDAWSLIGSLPLKLGLSDPDKAGWLSAAPRKVGGIGVVGVGSPTHFNDAHRSLPPVLVSQLLALPGAVSLQPQDTGARDFQDSAEIVAGLDVIVTVDTAAAHLAGSMGKPVWVLLPAVGTDWRWGRDDDISTWYSTARLFRQKAPGDWSGAVSDVVSALSDLRLIDDA